jgi:hypothetical protein
MSIKLSELEIPISIDTVKVLAGIGAVLGAVTGLIALTGKIIGDTVEYANTLDDIGDQLGTTSEESAGLYLMTKRLGGSVEDTTKMLVIMGKNLVTNDGKLGKSGLAFKRLGIDIYDANGKLKTSTQLFQEAATVLAAMPDGIEKTNLMMELFGKTGKEAGDLLALAADGGMQDYIDKAKEMGLVMSDEAIVASIQLGQSINILKEMFNGLKIAIGNELMPILAPLMDDFIEWATVTAMPWLIDKIKILGDWLGTNLPLAIDWLKTKWQELKIGIGEFYNSPFVQGVLTWLGNAYLWLRTNIPAAIDWVKQKWNELKDKVGEFVNSKQAQDVLTWLGSVYDWLLVQIPAAVVIVNGAFDSFESALQGVDNKAGTDDKSGTRGILANFAGFLGNEFHEAIEKTPGEIDDIRDAFKGLQEFYDFHVKPLLDTMNVFWNTILIPLWDRAKGRVEDLAEALGIKLPKAVEDLGNKITLDNAFAQWIADRATDLDNMRRTIQWLIDNMGRLFGLEVPSVHDTSGWIPDVVEPGPGHDYGGGSFGNRGIDNFNPVIDYDKLATVMSRTLRQELQRL